MKSFAYLFILILCTACAPQGLPKVEPSPMTTATKRPTWTSSPASTTPALFLPSPAATPVFDVLIDDVATGPRGQLYANGFGAYGDDTRHFTQWDGAEWVALGNGFPSAGSSLVVDGVGYLYTDILTDSEQGMATAIMRWDGSAWEDITGNFSTAVDALKAGRVSSNVPVAAIAIDGENNLYAAGAFYYPSADHTSEWSMGYVAKWNKDAWTVLGHGFDKVNIFAMTAGATGDLYVSGEQPLTTEGNSSFIVQWDDETWSHLGTSQLNTTQSITLDKSGRLYAYSQSNVIAYWDGTDWITIADQFGGDAPAVYDMAVDRNGQLCIGGSFEAVNNIPARYIACWDGDSWHALGEWVNERVNALAFDPNGTLYAVGFFTEAGGLPVDHAARWDGET